MIRMIRGDAVQEFHIDEAPQLHQSLIQPIDDELLGAVSAAAADKRSAEHMRPWQANSRER